VSGAAPKKSRKTRIVKLLSVTGVLCIICALFLILLSGENEIYLNSGSVLFFIGILLSIPDYWLFFRAQKQKNNKMAGYWLVKFLALPFMLVLLVVYYFFIFFHFD